MTEMVANTSKRGILKNEKSKLLEGMIKLLIPEEF
jgi:hypothetical protein